MTDLILLQKILNIYAWIAAGSIMIFVGAIANFYQKKFGVRTFHDIYLIPIIILFIPAFQLFPYFSFLGEMIELIGSLSSFIISYYLYRTMIEVK